MMNFDNIVNFLRKAMDEKCVIVHYTGDTDYVYICNNSKDEIYIELVDNYTINIETEYGNFDIEITPVQANLLRVILDTIDEYSISESEKVFINFFKEDNKSTSIDDLDEE